MAIIPFEFEHDGQKVTGKFNDDITTEEFDRIIEFSIKIKGINDVDLKLREYSKMITLAAVIECSAYKPHDINEWDKLGSKLAAKITKEVVNSYPLFPVLKEMISTIAGTTSYEIKDIQSVLSTLDGHQQS